jgi:hypothetical protein
MVLSESDKKQIKDMTFNYRMALVATDVEKRLGKLEKYMAERN